MRIPEGKINFDEPPFDLVGVEVALHRAGRVARRREAAMPRLRAQRRLDRFLDLIVRARVTIRDTLRAWRAGKLLSDRHPLMVGAEVAIHRAVRVAHRREAEMPRRRAEAELDKKLDREIRAQVIARLIARKKAKAAGTLFGAERDDRVEA